MFKLIANKDRSVLHFEISETISTEEVKEIANIAEEKIKEFKTIKCLIVLRHFKGYGSINSFFEDLKFGLGHLNSFSHIAIVGDNKLEEFITKLYSYIQGEVKYFDLSELDDAISWINKSKVAV